MKADQMNCRIGFAAFLSIALLAGTARAGAGFRCPSGRLVEVGQRAAEVLQVCGLPVISMRRVEKRTMSLAHPAAAQGPHSDVREKREIEIVIDDWTYDLGAARFLRFLQFEDGILVRVDEGARGTR